jgi:hypothetical protein
MAVLRFDAMLDRLHQKKTDMTKTTAAMATMTFSHCF